MLHLRQNSELERNDMSDVKKQIIIIDDDSEMCLVLQEMLEDSYTVTVATAGQDILPLLNPDISLVIADLVMPGDYDGIDCAVRALYRNAPTLLISGDPVACNRITTYGVYCLTKPFTGRELQQRIKDTLRDHDRHMLALYVSLVQLAHLNPPLHPSAVAFYKQNERKLDEMYRARAARKGIQTK